MTVEEAKLKYGNPEDDYYVTCESCPFHNDVCDCIELSTGEECSGYKETWEHIAKVMTEREDTQKIGEAICEKIDKAFGLNDDYRCNTCANGVFGYSHPTCKACIDGHDEGEQNNYEERCCDNCQFSDLDHTEKPCNECWGYDNWISPYFVVVDDKPTDNVIHPSHYNQGGIECWDAMEAAYGKEAVKHFCICNAFKYVWRADHKNGMEDINKAINYLNKYKELSEG